MVLALAEQQCRAIDIPDVRVSILILTLIMHHPGWVQHEQVPTKSTFEASRPDEQSLFYTEGSGQSVIIIRRYGERMC